MAEMGAAVVSGTATSLGLHPEFSVGTRNWGVSAPLLHGPQVAQVALQWSHLHMSDSQASTCEPWRSQASQKSQFHVSPVNSLCSSTRPRAAQGWCWPKQDNHPAASPGMDRCCTSPAHPAKLPSSPHTSLVKLEQTSVAGGTGSRAVTRVSSPPEVFQKPPECSLPTYYPFTLGRQLSIGQNMFSLVALQHRFSPHLCFAKIEGLL